jgi:hypothetical protein
MSIRGGPSREDRESCWITSPGELRSLGEGPGEHDARAPLAFLLLVVMPAGGLQSRKTTRWFAPQPSTRLHVYSVYILAATGLKDKRLLDASAALERLLLPNTKALCDQIF